MKHTLIFAPIVKTPYWTKLFELMCDASDFSIGVVLCQKHKKVFHIIYYAIKTVIEAQINYTTIKRSFFVLCLLLTNSDPISWEPM